LHSVNVIAQTFYSVKLARRLLVTRALTAVTVGTPHLGGLQAKSRNFSGPRQRGLRSAEGRPPFLPGACAGVSERRIS
jgi:hypothetical protein